MLIHTVQRRKYKSKLFKEMCSLLEVKKTRIMAFNPCSYGLVERMNKAVSTLVGAYIAEN